LAVSLNRPLFLFTAPNAKGKTMSAKYQTTFTPHVCNGKKALWKGTVTMRLPNYHERMELLDEAGFDLSSIADEDAAPGDELAARRRKKETTKLGVSAMKAAAKRAGDFVVAVDLTRLEDGLKVDSWEDVLYDSDLHPIVMEVGMKLIDRNRLGNVSKPS
jgi:hypothetical protein